MPHGDCHEVNVGVERRDFVNLFLFCAPNIERGFPLLAMAIDDTIDAHNTIGIKYNTCRAEPHLDNVNGARGLCIAAAILSRQ